jgi:uncharacterized membrane protein YfcA
VWALLALSGFIAGAINAIAGGGSLVSFPALMMTGMPPVTANATNTLAVMPGAASALLAYRKELGEERRTAIAMSWPALLGGLVGSVILLHTSERAFRVVVPWLILFACGLIAMQAPVARWVASRATFGGEKVRAPLWIAQFSISIYGGYFGAGQGILMLAAYAILLQGTLQHANAIRLWCGTLINAIAALYFLVVGAASLPEAAVMAAASLAGGYLGARLARRMPAAVLRTVVVAYGVAVAVRLLMTQ